MWGLDFALGQTVTDVRIETFKIERDIVISEKQKPSSVGKGNRRRQKETNCYFCRLRQLQQSGV